MIKKKILVTGGSGFVGSNFLKINHKKFSSIKATYYKKKKFKKFKNVKYINVNLEIFSNCKKICKDIDIIYMFASNSSGAKVIHENPLSHFTPNLIMNLNMLKAASESNVEKFVFLSSNTVYPNSKKTMKEEDINYTFFHKYHVVGWMKLFSEIACNIFSTKSKKKMDTVIFRPANLYGPFDKFDTLRAKVIPSIIRKAVKAKNKIEVWGSGLDKKDFLYIDDFVKIITPLSIKLKNHVVVNIASGKSMILKKIIFLILKILNKDKKIKIFYNKKKPTMIPVRNISIKKMKSLYKFNKLTTIDKGLASTIKWYLDNKY